MTIKKSLLAAATATTVAIAGTGIAAAQDEEQTSGSLSSSTSEEGDSTGSSLPKPDEDGNYEGSLGSAQDAAAILKVINEFGGAVAGSISILPNINDAVNDFQDMVDDISSKFPLPF
ncbi:hypothetical protein [Corynebacterium sp.]|uniref:hypothetical protein n=1 Tax=Corynebacterium sp. TaxID=1720 RepID=UPI003B3B814A